MSLRQQILVGHVALMFSSGCTVQPNIDTSVANGIYIRCGSSFAGTSINFVADDRLSITVFGDDGPWETETSGIFQFRGGKIIASGFETIAVEGPAPDVSIDGRLVWEVSSGGRDVRLTLIEALGSSIGKPWISVGDSYARSKEFCI